MPEEKINLKALEEQIDKFHENLTEIQLIQIIKQAGFFISNDGLMDSIESETNGFHPPILKKINKRRGNKKFNNHSLRKRK